MPGKKLPPRLRALDRRLLAVPSDEAMLLSTLDGFLAGLLVCPDLVLPGEWLLHVWSDSGSEADAPLFDDMAEAQAIIKGMMEHYNALALAFSQRRPYTPILEDDPRTGEILWEIWAEGFGRAVDLRPGSWTPITVQGDGETQEALAGLLDLVAISRHDSALSKARIDELTLAAPELIPGWVGALSAWRTAQAGKGKMPPVPSFGGTGRNDPCPCGSGRKHKKCCGLN